MIATVGHGMPIHSSTNEHDYKRIQWLIVRFLRWRTSVDHLKHLQRIYLQFQKDVLDKVRIHSLVTNLSFFAFTTWQNKQQWIIEFVLVISCLMICRFFSVGNCHLTTTPNKDHSRQCYLPMVWWGKWQPLGAITFLLYSMNEMR